MDRKQLCAPFPKEVIRTRPGRGGIQLSYIPAHHVVARLNDCCGEGWSFAIEEHQEWEGTEVIVLGRLEIEGVVKHAFGGSQITKDQDGNILSLADDLKSAASRSLVKAASLFGVGLELYGKGASEPHSPARATRPVEPAGTKPAPVTTPTGGASVRQLTAINAAARRHGFDRRRLSEYVAEHSGKRDISHLSRQEASSIIDSLNAAQAQHH